MNIHIPEVICMDCKQKMLLYESTTKRICPNCELEVLIEVREQ